MECSCLEVSNGTVSGVGMLLTLYSKQAVYNKQHQTLACFQRQFGRFNTKNISDILSFNGHSAHRTQSKLVQRPQRFGHVSLANLRITCFPVNPLFEP